MAITEHPSTQFAGFVQADAPTDNDHPNGAVAVGDMWFDDDDVDGIPWNYCSSTGPIVWTEWPAGDHDEDHASRHADGGADELAIQDLATDAAEDGQIFTGDGSGGVTVQDNEAVLTFVIDGGGSAITTGIKGDLEVAFAGTITAVRALADQSGSIVVDIWKDTYANFPPTDADSITASTPVTISTATKAEDTTLTSWTTSIVKGDILRFNVDSITSLERVTISISVRKT